MTKRIGLAGLGRQGKRYVKTLDALDLRLDAVMSVNHNPYVESLGRMRSALPGDWEPIPHFFPDDRVEFLADIDLVIIATPAATHADLVCAALEAGKSCLVEKPMVTTREELERVREAWERTGTPLVVAHTHCWAPSFLELREKALGKKLVNALAEFGNPDEDWDRLEWSPHGYALGESIGHKALIRTPPFEERERSFSVDADGEWLYYDGDAPCSPTPLARLVDDFVNLREDWRWGLFGFRVMDMVLEGMGKR